MQRHGIQEVENERRSAAVAGKFYPADAAQLREVVTQHLDASGLAAAKGRVAVLVAPHAGYLYSGPTAGHAYARVRGGDYKRVILLGRSHHYAFPGFHVHACDAFETPLGALPVDGDFAEALGAETGAVARRSHAEEHTLEVQLPFIQVALGNVAIVPVLFGADPGPENTAFAAKLDRLCGEDDLVVASTDLSHFLSDAEASEIDHVSLEGVLAGDPEALAAGLGEGRFSMCGGSAVYTAMHYAKARDAAAWQLLDYRNSAAASGDRDRVVGYGAISMESAA